MIKFKRYMTAITLMLFMLLGLVACGNENGASSKASGTESGKQKEESETEPAGSGKDVENEQAAALTLADGEAKLIYAKDNYVVAAFHGPDGDVGAYFCDADGNRIDDQVGYGNPSEGWSSQENFQKSMIPANLSCISPIMTQKKTQTEHMQARITLSQSR